MKSVDELSELFRLQGRKVTAQRTRIFNVLIDNPTHPTAEAVYLEAVADMPSLSLRTVYQTLNDLTSMGELRSLDLGTGSVRFDPMTEDHQHVVCVSCGSVTDVAVDVSEVTVSGAAASDFVVDSTDVVFRGRCGPCIKSI